MNDPDSDIQEVQPAKPPDISVVVRAYEEDDRNFISSGYMNDFWYHGIRRHHFHWNEFGEMKLYDRLWIDEFTPASTFLKNSVYKKGQIEIFNSFMERSNVWMAVNPRETWQCYGFIIAEDDEDSIILHYIYVKGTYRRMRVGSALLTELLDTSKKLIYTHHTVYWFYMLKKLEEQGFKMTYNPYLAR